MGVGMGAFSGVRTLKSIRGTFSSGGLDLGFRGVGVGLASFFSRNLIN